MAHINKLPVELLSEIFRESVVFFPDILGTHSFRYVKKEAPVNLIHVCKKWREITLSLSSIWGSQYFSGLPPKKSLEEVEYWIQISPRTHLKLVVFDPMVLNDPDPEPPSWTELLKVYAKHMDRWHTLFAQGSDKLAQELTSSLSNAKAPPLDSLQVVLLPPISTSAMNDLAASINHIKTLRRLHWTNAYGLGDVDIDNLPWGQLSDVVYKAKSTPEQFLARLSRCQSAHTVALRQHGRLLAYQALSTFNHPHTTLSRLTSLTLQKSTDPLNILRFFTLPSLQYLQIAVLDHSYEYLGELLLRSACPLDTLVIEDVEESSLEDLTLFFRHKFLLSISNVKYVGKWHMSLDYLIRTVEKLRDPAANPSPLFAIWSDPALGQRIIGWSATPQKYIIRIENGISISCIA
ncbi:hypothetical protein CPB84DRAFT_1487449 [Gymnopilus junonius]|uniref:F-box domain-containing protein n=1 Tax=Gymnopilus junonius TaxID=109634 RepID=A0A9P5NFJ3_GYMJU|nr:hypothetical protein CPB84DRAFT_1487449 [Gymnopilus junonius]